MSTPIAPRARPEDELMALAVSVASVRERAASRLAWLVRQAHPDTLLDALEQQRLLTLVAMRSAELGAPLPEPCRAAARKQLERGRHRSQAFEVATIAALRQLGACGIPALPLKGAALSEAIYSDPGLRTFVDIDVLVAADALSEARHALGRLGYRWRRDAARHGALPELHDTLLHRDGALPPVELHWRVHWYERRFSAEMLARMTGCVLPRTDRASELASLLLFYARDGFVGLRLAADVAAWWDRYCAELEPDGLAGITEQHPELRRALEAAAAAAEQVVGAPIVGILEPRRRDHRRCLGARLADWDLRGDPDQIAANRTLVDGLLAPTGDLTAFVRRALVVPADVLDDYYELSADDRTRRLLWRLLHPPKILMRYALALWRLRRGRRWSPILVR